MTDRTIPLVLTLLAAAIGDRALAGASAPDRVAHAPDPPASVLQHLERAQGAAGGGDLERALDEVRRGLSLQHAGGRAAYDKARLELWAIQWRDREVGERIAADEPERARDLLMRMSEPLASDFARHRFEILEQRLEAAEQRRDGAAARAADPARALAERRLAAGARLLERAERQLDESRAASRRTVYSARRAEAALHDYRAVERALFRWFAGKELPDPVAERWIALQRRADDGAVRAMLRIADARTTQGDFRGALGWIDAVELRAPGHEDAQRLRRTVQIASAASAPWLGAIGVPAWGAVPR